MWSHHFLGDLFGSCVIICASEAIKAQSLAERRLQSSMEAQSEHLLWTISVLVNKQDLRGRFTEIKSRKELPIRENMAGRSS